MAGEEMIPGVGDSGAAVAEAPAGDEVIDDGAAPAGDAAGGGDEAAPAGDEAAPAGDETQAEGAELAEIETDGRKLEGKIRESVAKLAKVDKVAAKELRETYFRNQAFMKEVPDAKTPGEAIAAIRNMRATIDSLGGEQGITELQTEVQDYRNEIQQFANGDRALIEQLYDPKNPQGLIRAARNAFDVLGDKNPEAYDEALLPHFTSRLEKANIPNVVKNLLALVHDGKGQESYDLLGKLDQWLTGLKEKSANIGKSASADAKDPEREAAAADREAARKERDEAFQTRVTDDVNRLNNTEIEKHVGPLQKQLGLQKAGMNHFRNGLVARVWKVLANDKAYIKSVQTIRAKGDSVKTADFIHKAFVERLPEQFRLHRNEIYPNIGAKPKPPAPGAEPANGQKKTAPVNIAQGQRPPRDKVDWSKTTDTMWIAGMAYLTDGKFVKGFKDAPANRL